MPTGASAIVGYASAWIIPAMAGFLAVTTAKMARLNSGLIVTGCVLLLVSCLLWMVTLYAGAMTITHGKRIASLWCTASNPFWYVAILSLWLR